MKLYGSLASNYVARVALAARAKGLDLPIELPAGGIKTPEYLAMNPFGKMPTLEHDGRYLIESTVMLEYLEDLFPTPALLPKDPWDAAQARLLVRLMDIYAAPEIGVLFRNMNPATRDTVAVDAAKAKLDTAITHVEHYLAAAPFAAGTSFSIADCTLLPNLLIMRKTVIPAAGVPDPTVQHPKWSAWFAHMRQHPLTAAFIPEYEAAVDAFLKRLAGG